jgi:hypothetical protein
MAYYQFKDEMGDGFGSCEVFFMSENDLIAYDWVQPDGDGGWYRDSGYGREEYSLSELAGWYWQACFPGCMPDGEPMGPFETELEAMDHAQVVTD